MRRWNPINRSRRCRGTDNLVTSSPRGPLAIKDDGLERRTRALESREDEVYRKWRDQYHELRYRAPTVTRLFQAAFEIAPPNPETSC
jgi:hypothetical protein